MAGIMMAFQHCHFHNVLLNVDAGSDPCLFYPWGQKGFGGQLSGSEAKYPDGIAFFLNMEIFRTSLF